MTRRLPAAALPLLALLLTLPAAAAAPPDRITFQGRLTDASGNPVNGSKGITFGLYIAPSGGAPVWSETQSLTLSGGLYNAFLGDVNTAIDALPFDQPYYLGITVAGDAEMGQRYRLAASPYAFRAKVADLALTAGSATSAATAANADTLDGLHAVAFSLATHNHDAAYWRLGGNAGTTPGTHFLGTTDNAALELRVLGARALRIEPATIPNLVGGQVDNAVTPGVFGAAIAGGGNGGAWANRVTDSFGFVGGGSGNRAGDDAGTTSDMLYATVGGGLSNIAGNYASFVGGGSGNASTAPCSTIAGGFGNIASIDYATVAGGAVNTANNMYATVGGGYHHVASGAVSTIGGGYNHVASGAYATVGGGSYNEAGGSYATVAGGAFITASALYAAVGGGYQNESTGNYATVGGGYLNTASINDYATVSGGCQGTASGYSATVGGGTGNTASGYSATVGGGDTNTASGNYAAVVGGYYCEAAGDYSIAAGRMARIDAAHDGTFLFSDQSGFYFSSAAANEFAARATGGVRFVTAVNGGSGAPTKTFSIAGTGDVAVQGTVTADAQLVSTVATGTAPLGVSSTTRVANLNADLLDGSHASDFAPAGGSAGYIQNQTAAVQSAGFNISGNAFVDGLVGIGTTTPGAKLHVQSASGTGIFGSVSDVSGTTYGVLGRSDSTSGRGLAGFAYATSGTTYGVHGQSTSPSGTGIRGYAAASAGATFGVVGEVTSPSGWGLYTPNRLYAGGDVGIGTTTPAAKLDVAGGSIRTNAQLVSTVATGTAPLGVSSNTMVNNLNADMLDGFHAGNASGNVPISNGTLNTNLNADLIDGLHASAFAPATGSTAYLARGGDTMTGTLTLATDPTGALEAATKRYVDARVVGLWRLGGNAGTAPGTDFIGTTDNVALELKVNGARAFRLEPNATSPSVIGGYAGNAVTSGVLGASIGGGGSSLNINRVAYDYGTVAGGSNNLAGYSSAVGGGNTNTAIGNYATVGGGISNFAGSSWATVGGGNSNKAGADAGGKSFATVGGGGMNNAEGEYSTIGGGQSNQASGGNCTVGGGQGNSAAVDWCTVGGGQNNQAVHFLATVGGGGGNSALGFVSTVCGGGSNTASGYYASVCGGSGNTAAGDYCFAAGFHAKIDAAHDGTFLFSDSNDIAFNSAAANEFAARATGGVRFVTAINGTTGVPTAGVQVAAGGTSWSSISDRNAKKGFRPVDGEQVLDKLAQMPVTYWQYTWQPDNAVPLIGPVAQDFVGAFYPGMDDTRISTQQSDGVHFAAIKALEQRTRELREENATLRDRLAKLEATLQASAR
jgi:trimeric autotransporter adhesin